MKIKIAPSGDRTPQGGPAVGFDVEVPREFWHYFFAGLALHVIKDEHVELSPDETAVWSRKYADALIAELEKGGRS